MKNKRQSLDIFVPITEIGDESVGSAVKVDANLIAEITDGDDNPQFIIVEMDEGQSASKYNYDSATLEDIAKQVNEKQPVGYLGHKHFQGKDKEDLLPDPQTLWLGATTVKNGGKTTLLVKGYNLPGAKIRDWIKRKVVNTVSWSADAVVSPASGGGYDIKEFILESIDWSRKNRNGMKGQRLTVVTEMEGDEEVDETLAESVAKLTLQELKEYAPRLITVIKEQQAEEDEAVKETALKTQKEELDTAHANALAAVPEISEVKKLREFLKIDEAKNLVDAIVEMYEKFEGISKKAVQQWFIEEVLPKKVTSEKARSIIARMIPVTEMEGDWLSETEVTKMKVKLEERIDDALENDPEIKVIVTEMAATRGGLRLHSSDKRDKENEGDDGKSSDYKENSFFAVETQAVG